MIDAACLIAVVSGWLVAVACAIAWRRAVADAGATVERLLASVEAGEKAHAVQVNEFVDRLMSMRRDGFGTGGGRAVPEQREPLPAEIESFLRELEPETASICREWAMAQREFGMGDVEIYEKLALGSEIEDVLSG